VSAGVDVPMPRLTDSMEEGTIVSRLVEDGAEVRRGQEIVEIETDKATMVFESPEAGVLRVLAGVGESVVVGAPIAVVGGSPEDQAARRAGPVDSGHAHTGLAAGARASSSPPARSAKVADGKGAAAPSVPAVGGDSAASAPAAGNGRVSASPVARRLARDLGVELASVTGSGPGGRIVKTDVEAAGAAGAGAGGATEQAASAAGNGAAAPAVPAAAPAGSPGGAKGAGVRQLLTRSQQVVARRMAESRATVPDFSVTSEVDMTAALELRRELRAALDSPPTVNDLIVAAAARALREHPYVNASFDGDAFVLHERINVGIAVAVEHELYVPTLFDADRTPLGTLAAQARGLVERARAGALTPPELSGGTFTVSNLGMFGVRSFEPIVNAPQAAILAVGGVNDAGVACLTLVSDHRIVYGAHAAAFLRDLRGLLERPLRIVA
jgi:pyruvate dehydrogenase E2 component (dihydrolipoamide acetyltransferase)